MPDSLRDYQRNRSAESFRQVVRANVDMVYSQCRRELRDPAAADDVTQQVFVILAAKAGSISGKTPLGGWLFNTTRYCCRNYKRAAFRRRIAESKAAFMRKETIEAPASDDLSTGAEPILNDSLADLNSRDRDALLLRFFQNQSLRDVGLAMGVSEDAAKQRVSRAIEKLRQSFARRGVTASTAGTAIFLASAVKPASSKAAETALHACVASTAAATGHASAATVIALPKVAAGLLIAAALTTGAMVIHAASAQNAAPAVPVVAAAAALPDAAPVMADATTPIPATQPFSQSTPLGALQKLSAALDADDHDAVDECLCDDGKDAAQAKLGHAVVQFMGCAHRLDKAWKDKFNANTKVSGLNFNNIPDGDYVTLIRGTADAGDALEISFQGDEARIRVPVPAEKFTGTSIDRLAAMGRWSGAMLIFNNIDGNWKLNTDRTFNIMVTVNRRPGNRKDSVEISANIGEGISSVLDDVASQIESGKITTKSRAASAVRSGVGKVFRNNDVDGSTFTMLPVIGGGG
jgi:RNA polymerase sigma factor (sigma-70 family)